MASVDYGAAGKGLMSSAARLTLATGAALTRAAELGTSDAPVHLAFPLLGAGHGGLGVGVSLKAMVDGMKRFFREKCELAKSRLDQLLVLR